MNFRGGLNIGEPIMQLTYIKNHPFFVPDDDLAATDAVKTAKPILLDDEYILRPIHRAGHHPRYFADVGGNCGAFAMAAAKLFPGLDILWMEPFAMVAECYRANVADLPIRSVEAGVAAVGPDDPQSIELVCFPGHHGGNYRRDAWNPPYAHESHTAITVPTDRLSRLLAIHEFPRIDILKIDCEGSEASVLEDLRQTGWLHLTRWIRFEWHGRENLARCLELLKETHIAHADRSPNQPNGFGLAHSRLDS